MKNKAGSRKYKLAFFCLLLITGCLCVSVVNPSVIPALFSVIGGIVAIYTVYCGGNVANKAALGKWQKAKTNPNLSNERGE